MWLFLVSMIARCDIISHQMYVVTNDHAQDETEAGKQTIVIQSKHLHPDYDSPDRANDIALLRLKEPAVMGDTVSPACLPEQGDFGDDSSFPEGKEVRMCP